MFEKLNNAKPIITQGDMPGSESGIFNPATMPNCGTYLFCRQEDAKGENTIRVDWTRDGIHIEKHLGVALRFPPERVKQYLESLPKGQMPHIGWEDPRGWKHPITGKLYLVAVENSGKGCRNRIAVSDDYVNFKLLPPPFPYETHDDKDAAFMGLTPDGKTIAVRRPMKGPTGWGMVVAIGDSMEGPYHDVAEYKPRTEWEGERTGASQFVELKGMGKRGESWYMGMHHGAYSPNGHWVYSSGLDLWDQYGRMIATASDPQLVPTTKYEKEGFEGKEIALCTGLEIVAINGEKYLRAYYGAGDHHVMVAQASVKESLEYMLCPKNMIPEATIDKKIFLMGNYRRRLDEAA